jgi:hypothetical protein
VLFFCFVCLRLLSCAWLSSSTYCVLFFVLFVFVFSLMCGGVQHILCCDFLFCLSSSFLLCVVMSSTYCIVFFVLLVFVFCLLYGVV